MLEIEVDANQLRQKLGELSQLLSGRKLAAALRPVLRKFRNELKAGAKSWSAPPRVRSRVATGIGYSLKVKRGTLQHAKIGFGVGKATRRGATKKRTRPGVGIGKANVHWFVLGTTDRQTKAGKNRGRVQPYFKGFMDQFSPRITEEATAEIARVIREAVAKIEAKKGA